MKRFRRPLAFLALPLMLLPALEAALWTAGRAAERVPGETASRVVRKFSPLDSYPRRPEDYVKVAIFGESAAAGYGALRGFDIILKHELESRYPDRKFYFKNFAEAGYPFHGFEAEFLKREIGRYDLILVYAGLAESMRYADESGLFRSPEEKHRRGLKAPSWADGPRRFLARKSLVYSFYTRLSGLLNALLGKPGALVHCNRFQIAREEIQAPIFPEREKERFVADYARDMRDVAELASRLRKHVIVAGIIIKESSPPHFSMATPGLDEESGLRMRALLARGSKLLEKGRPAQALRPLLEARGLDGRVAIVNHRIGRAYWALGRRAQARRFFLEGNEDDGLPFRYVRRLNAAAAAQDGKGYFHYIDTVRDMGRLIERGYEYEELFNDMEHPGLLGHAFLAREFLCLLPGLPPADAASGPACLDWERADLRKLGERYRRDLLVSPQEEAGTALMMAQWHFSNSSMTAYPEELLAEADVHLDEYRRKIADEPSARSADLLLQAWISAARGASPGKSMDLLNQALELTPAYVRSQWLADSGNGKTMQEMFRGWGIVYDAAGSRFAGAPDLPDPA